MQNARCYFSSFCSPAICLKAEPKIMYCVLPAIVPSFCPQRKGQSSKFSKWSGLRKSSPGATLPGMNEKSARLLP